MVSTREPTPAPEAGARSFTTARWTGRGVRFEGAHLARLERDASTLGLGDLDREAACRALRELGHAAFGAGEGVVRLEIAAGPGGRAAIGATARNVGRDPTSWRAISLPLVHDGRSAPSGAKLSRRPLYERAVGEATRAGVDEALLFDDEGRLVEGARTNLVAVGPDGVPRVPPESRGAVAGVALAVAFEGCADLTRGDVARDELDALRELVALNAVRGAVPVVELDGRPVGGGRPGPVATRLAAVLDAAHAADRLDA